MGATKEDVLSSITNAVAEAMPYPSQILEAIGAGVEAAVTKYLDENGLPRTRK